jgi:Domain of unknown function (DUF4915)
VILIRNAQGTLNTHFRAFAKPMGLAADVARLAIGGTHLVWEYRNIPAVAHKLEPLGTHDACYLPRRIHVSGDIDIHELAWARDGELWLVNTRFSCLCTLDTDASFTPRWRPPFVTTLAPQDRCHLNGLAIVDGRPTYVTALGATDTPAGWRAQKADGGVLLDIPHSELWRRMTAWYAQLQALTRRLRRALQRKHALPLMGVALLLALGQGLGHTGTIVVDGTTCTLLDAITAANTDTPQGAVPPEAGPTPWCWSLRAAPCRSPTSTIPPLAPPACP